MMPVPTALDYARHHGIAIDHKSQDLSLLLYRLLPLPCEVDNGLPDLTYPSCEQLIAEEKLQLGLDAGRILAQSIQPTPGIDSSQLLDDPYRVTKLKLEMPMLNMDHEQDMKWFRKKVDLSRLISRFSDSLVDASPLSEDPDIQVQCTDLAAELDMEIQSEKLQIPKEALRYLSSTQNETWTEQDASEAMDRELWFERRDVRCSPLPFLTPLFEPQHYELPPVPELVLEPRSEEDVDLDNLLLQIEKEMEIHDRLSCTTPSKDCAHTGVLVYACEPGSSPIVYDNEKILTAFRSNSKKRKYSPNLSGKIDSLWYSPISSSCTSADNTRSKRVRTQMESNELRHTLPPSDSDRDEDMTQLLDEDTCHVQQDNVITPIPEQYSEPEDKCSPYTDFYVEVPALPDRHDNEKHTSRTSPISASDMLQVVKCEMKLQDLVNDENLRWWPAPSEQFQMPLNEKLDQSTTPERFMTKPACVIRSEQLLWKQNGLRILDQGDSSEDEILIQDEFDLEEQDFDEQQTISVVDSKVKKLESPAADSNNLTRKQRPGLCDVHIADSTTSSKLKLMQSSNTPAGESPPEQLLLHTFSDFDLNGLKSLKRFHNPPSSFNPSKDATEGLASFLDLRGKRFKKPDDVTSNLLPHSLAREITTDSIQVSQVPVGGVPSFESRSRDEFQVPSSQTALPRQMWLPKIRNLILPLVVFFDTALLRNHSLTQLLDEQGNGKLQVVYRDIGDNADIILNPKTCVILTNMQALMQKSLPGQTRSPSGVSQVQQRIAKLGSAFECVFVLVSVPNVQHCHTSELNDFASFCASLRSLPSGQLAVSPIWILKGESVSGSLESRFDPTSVWIWSLIVEHGLPRRQPKIDAQQDLVFLDEETLWERFLRETGMNIMAAQVLLSAVKKIPGAKHERLWGLRKLFQMDVHDRANKFGEILGHASLSKLEHAIDRKR